MTAIAQGGVSSAALPRVVATWVVTGFLTDVEDVVALEFRLVDPLGAAGAWADTITELSPGRYVLEFAVAGGAELGTWHAEWRGSAEAGIVAFEVVAALEPIPDAYATVAQARDEGVPATYDDARVAKALVKASREMEKFTRRLFGARYSTVQFDGHGAPILALDREVVAVEELTLDHAVVAPSYLHVTTGFYDTGANKIEWRAPTDTGADPDPFALSSSYLAAGTFTRGTANVDVTGLWGYVEPLRTRDLEDLAGQVPPLIVEATIRLSMRRIRRSWKYAPKGGATVLGPITTERTRAQSVSYGKANNNSLSYTGDPEVDRVIAQYRRGFIVGIQ